MKKTYISPNVNVINIDAKTTIMAGSFSTNNDPTSLDNARSSRYSSPEWDEEEYEDM